MAEICTRRTVLVSCPREKESRPHYIASGKDRGKNWSWFLGRKKMGLRPMKIIYDHDSNGKQLVRRVCVDPRKQWEVKVEKVGRSADLICNSGEGLGLTEEEHSKARCPLSWWAELLKQEGRKEETARRVAANWGWRPSKHRLRDKLIIWLCKWKLFNLPWKPQG